MENNILSSINSLKDKILNLNEIKNLQNKNEKLLQKYEQLERHCAKYNALAQYGRQNNIILSCIPDSVSDDMLEESVISVLGDIDVYMKHQDLVVCHRFGEADRQKSKKTIVRFINRKNCKKVLSNKKKLDKIDCRKHSFTNNTKIFAIENLTSIAYNSCKLKCNGLIHSCFSRDCIARMKCEETAKPVNIFHMEKLHQLFPDFEFGSADENDDIFLDASQVANDSTKSS